jgi:hypothetical protein
MAAFIAKASMMSETWRCQPCQERVSLWSSPNSFFAASKLSSMAQRLLRRGRNRRLAQPGLE